MPAVQPSTRVNFGALRSDDRGTPFSASYVTMTFGGKCLVGLAQAGSGFVLVNRAQLQKLLAELKLGQSGLADPVTAKQFGKLAGADALVVGAMTFFGDTVRVTVQVLDSETAALVAASAISISRTAAVDKLNECVDSPSPANGDVTAPAKPAFENKFVRITLTSLTASYNTVSVGLSVQNVTTAPLRLSSRACSAWELAADNGAQLVMIKSLGLSHQRECGFMSTGSNYTFGAGGGSPQVQYSEGKFADFEPGVPVPLVFQFESSQGRPGNAFTLTGELLASVRSRYETFAVVLPGLTRK